MATDTKNSVEDTRLDDNQNPYNKGSSIDNLREAEKKSTDNNTFDSMMSPENYSKDGKSGDLSGGTKNAEQNPDSTYRNNFKEDAKVQ